jgi:hypothetical protein
MIDIIILSALIVAAGRFTIPGHDLSVAGTYEAIAHIWVGAMIVLAFDERYRTAAIAALVATTVLETVMFLLRRR